MSTLPAALFEAARTNPQQAALEVWGPHDGVTLRVTYKELSDNVCAASILLSSTAGIIAGDRVAFLAHNSVAYVALSLGAMACGATSVNLSWRSPDAIVEACCRDLRVKLLFASSPFKKAAASIARSVPGVQLMLLEAVCAAPLADNLPFPSPTLGECAEIISREAAREGDSAEGGSAVAAIFFTGGTTGMPKAVPHTHAALLWQARAVASEFPSGLDLDSVPHAGTVCFTPYFHVMGFCANLLFNLVAGVRAAILR